MIWIIQETYQSSVNTRIDSRKVLWKLMKFLPLTVRKCIKILHFRTKQNYDSVMHDFLLIIIMIWCLLTSSTKHCLVPLVCSIKVLGFLEQFWRISKSQARRGFEKSQTYTNNWIFHATSIACYQSQRNQSTDNFGFFTSYSNVDYNSK